jgi:lysyl-tRNA synthetase, class II
MFEFDPERLEKLQSLRDQGVEPYPHGLSIADTTAAVRAHIGDRDEADLAQDAATFQIAGRLMAKREMGKAGFARIQDRGGELQVYVRREDLGEEAFALWRRLDLGDHIAVSGRCMRTRTGEASLHASSLRLSAKCIASMPDKHKGVEDREFRSRQRYVDLFINEDSREVFRRRSADGRYIRRFFEDRDFIEVETPMMQPIPGGAAARPFVTHHNALDIELYLRIAPELYLKRLVVGGSSGSSRSTATSATRASARKHNPEFTMLEFYQAYATYEDLMDLTEELLSALVQAVCGTTSLPFNGHT